MSVTPTQLLTFLLPTFLFVMPMSGQDSADRTHQTVRLPASLDRVLRDYERAWRAGDEVELASLFTQDGFVLSPGRAPVRGRGLIEERYANSGGPLVLRALAYSVADSVGYIIGAYAATADGPDVGKFVLALRANEDGRWLIAADMDNGNS